jgi:hypothetical protein
LQRFSLKLLYKPSLLRLKKIFGKVDSPFPWVVITK